MIGCIKNRKTNKIAVKKDKLFVPCAYVSIVIIGLGVLFVIISAFANMKGGGVLVYGVNNDGTCFNLTKEEVDKIMYAKKQAFHKAQGDAGRGH